MQMQLAQLSVAEKTSCFSESSCKLHIDSTLYLGNGVVNDLLVGQVTLVSDQQFVDAFRGVTINLREPLLDVVEGVLVCHIIDDNDTVCAAVVGGGDGAETLLACTVFCDMLKKSWVPG